ncbi:MAG: hypothetical protein CMO16_05795 [Thaumarchaeota archaeon]|nr:hypothetical protein [Nitrososphaerota archaeon]
MRRLLNMKIIESRKILSLLPSVITTSSFGIEKDYNYFSLRTKLEILAVISGMKHVYYDAIQLPERDSSNSSSLIDPEDESILTPKQIFGLDVLRQLESLAPRMQLLVKRTNFPRINFLEATIVPSHIVAAHSRTILFGRVIWLYLKHKTEDLIEKVLKGNLWLGQVLGYPSCCVRWSASIRTRFLEGGYNYFISTNNNAEEWDVLNYLHSFKEHYPGSEIIRAEVDSNILETWNKYPFVPHWACPSCLNGESDTTAFQNEKFSELALAISSKFHDDIINESKKVVQELRKYYNESTKSD